MASPRAVCLPSTWISKSSKALSDEVAFCFNSSCQEKIIEDGRGVNDPVREKVTEITVVGGKKISEN